MSTEHAVDEMLAALDFEPTLPCESKRHARATGGHVPEQPATWIIERTHPTDPHHTADDETFVAQQLVCVGRVEYIRARLSSVIRCAGCGKRAELSRFIRIIGPIQGASS